MKAWKEGVITGFLLIPVLFAFCYPLMGIAAILKAETLARIVDAIFMLPHAPMAIVHKRLGITAPFILTSMLFWSVIGAGIGYLYGRWREK